MSAHHVQAARRLLGDARAELEVFKTRLSGDDFNQIAEICTAISELRDRLVPYLVREEER